MDLTLRHALVRDRLYFLLLFVLAGSVGCQTDPRSQNNSKNNFGDWGQRKSFSEFEQGFKGDYQILSRKGKENGVLMAIHGGQIEKGTDQLVESMAHLSKMSYYVFKGFKAPDYSEEFMQSGHMHLTSHKFDDPDLIKLAKSTSPCLSIHGFPGFVQNKKKTKTSEKRSLDFCVGGLHDSLSKKIVSMLEREFPEFESCQLCCPPYLGKHKKNVVNLCEGNQGVQVELSPKVRRRILDGDQTFKLKLSNLLINELRNGYDD